MRGQKLWMKVTEKSSLLFTPKLNISQCGQIHFVIWTNIFCNLDKYINQFGQQIKYQMCSYVCCKHILLNCGRTCGEKTWSSAAALTLTPTKKTWNKGTYHPRKGNLLAVSGWIFILLGCIFTQPYVTLYV